MFGLGLLQHPRDLARLMHEKPCLIPKVTMCSTLKFRFSFRSSGLRLSVRSLDSISVAGFLSTFFSAVASLLHQLTALSSTLTLLYAVIYLQGVSLLRVYTKLCISDGQVIFPGTCVFPPLFFSLGTSHLISGGGQVHLGGPEKFWPSAGGSEVNNPWSRGIHIF